MSKNILIDTTNNIETRIAVTDDGKLDDFEIEPSKKNAVKGDIYLAKITRIEPSLQAAFVDFGRTKHGFLAFNDIQSDYYQIPTADKERIKSAEENGAEITRLLFSTIDIADMSGSINSIFSFSDWANFRFPKNFVFLAPSFFK